MLSTTLIVPGWHGSGPEHWQTWLESQLPDARRVSKVDWDVPILARWSGAVRNEIDRVSGAVWLVAHSFGCLAAVVAAADRADRVAGALLVAPADPDRFSPLGFRGESVAPRLDSVAPWLPRSHLPFPSIVVASTNDPWAQFMKAAYWAERWGSRLISLGPAGHINIDAGFGPWPEGLELLRALQQSQGGAPLGNVGEIHDSRRGRGSALARLRHRTRLDLATSRGETE